MHILFVASAYPAAFHRPTDNIFFHEQATAINRAGHRVSILVTPRLDVSLAYFRSVRHLSDWDYAIETMDEIPIYRMHFGWAPYQLPRLRAAFVDNAGRRVFNRYVEQYGKPDILHAQNILFGGYLAAKIKATHRIPLVLSEHTSYLYQQNLSTRHRQLAAETIRSADICLAVSPLQAEALNTYFPMTKFEVVGNMVNTDYFEYERSKLSEVFTWAIVGRIIPIKGHDLLLRAFRQAFHKQPVQLRIIGDGHWRQSIAQLVQALELADQVSFTGNLSRQQLRSQLQQVHAVVSSSHVETFGITLIEAMACGKPVVATRSGGPESIVNDSNGCLVPSNDVEALARAMQHIYLHYQDYDPRVIRRFCIEHFGEASIVRRLTTCYGRAMSKTSGIE